MDSESDSPWSDTSEEDEANNRPLLQSRAYQIEMLEASMKQNIVAVVDSGNPHKLLTLY